MGSVNDLLKDVPIPRMVKVHQEFDGTCLTDIPEAVSRELLREKIIQSVKPGMRIAITAGSRGIDNIVPVLRETVDFLKAREAKPFIVPAMGSHGGATAEGQRKLLEGYGITEESTGVPIYASMETETACISPEGYPLQMDRYAFEADGIVLLNRIKCHTGFHGKYESGLLKMLVIGLGKQKGAEFAHSFGPPKMAWSIEHFGKILFDPAKILFGVALIENAFDKTAGIRALAKDEILTGEPELLQWSKSMMPRIFFPKPDILVVDRIGKNISGPGMDPNITGSYLSNSGISRENRAERIVVLNLTSETHGSAMGIGMADITTKRLFKEMDLDATYPNCLTAGTTESARIPMMFDSDRLAIQAAIKTLNRLDNSGLRVVHIRDTLHIGDIEISESMIREAETLKDVRIAGSPFEIAFDENGNLI
jgi:hypothetical protein